ncbi:unnamed protein product, partial [Rotaria sp. Silwood1]
TTTSTTTVTSTTSTSTSSTSSTTSTTSNCIQCRCSSCSLIYLQVQAQLRLQQQLQRQPLQKLRQLQRQQAPRSAQQQQLAQTGVGLSSTTGRINQSILFNVSGAYFQAGGFTLLGVVGQAYSISLWVNKALSTSGGGTLLHVSANSNGTSWCIPMLGLTSSNEIIAQSWNSFMMTVQGPVLQLGVWTHIVTSYSINNSVRLWINGTLIGSSTTFTYAASSSPDWITVGTTFPAAMSCASGSISTGQFYGMIDELRVYSRELTSSDVYALANP